MTHNSIVRQFIIDHITDTPNPIMEWFDELWSRLYVKEADVFHNKGGELIYYDKINDNTKQYIFFRDDNNDRFWCTNINYWIILVMKFSLSYSDIVVVTKIMVDNALNGSVSNPMSKNNYEVDKIKYVLNNSIATPSADVNDREISVISVLKNIL